MDAHDDNWRTEQLRELVETLKVSKVQQEVAWIIIRALPNINSRSDLHLYQIATNPLTSNIPAQESGYTIYHLLYSHLSQRKPTLYPNLPYKQHYIYAKRH